MFSILLCSALVLTTAVDPGQKVDVANLRFQRPLDLEGRIHRLDDADGKLGTTFVFLSPEMPNSAELATELNRIAESEQGSKTKLFGVIGGPLHSRSAAAGFASSLHPKFPVLFDATNELSNILKPSHVPEAILLNTKNEVVYRGRIDNGSTERLLFDAIGAFTEGRPIARPSTESVGIPYPDESAETSPVTFNRHIAPILLANCTECHRTGQVAPFSLLTYEDAAKRAEFLTEVTTARQMPPWRAEIDYGHFADERRLTDAQLGLIQSWAKAGAPRGDEADLPPTPDFPSGWRLGNPDLVVEVPAPFDVPADGPDIFQHFVLPVSLPADKTLIGFEFRPSNAAVSHHAVIFFDASGQARALDAETPEPGYRTSGSVGGGVTAMVGVWTPGMTARHYPEGIGVHVPKTVDVVLQLHLHPTGKPEAEQSKIALYFSDKPAKEVRRQEMLLLGSLAIDIPAGRDNHPIGSSITLPIDVTLLSVFPHLHLIGKEIKVTATLPGGEAKPLIWIKDWNFYWQDSYLYQEPIRLPKGTRIQVEAAYNNSPENPLNPSSPPKRVLFGNGSADEMCFAFFQIVTDEPKAMMRIAPALMQSFLTEWQKADIDDEAREKIVDEAGKLFGRQSTQMLRNMLLRNKKESNKS